MNAYIELAMIISAIIMCSCLSSVSDDNTELISAIILTCVLAPFSIGSEFQNPSANIASWIIAGVIVAYFSAFYMLGVRSLLCECISDDNFLWTFKNTVAAAIGLSIHGLLFLIPLGLTIIGATLALRRAIYIAIVSIARA